MSALGHKRTFAVQTGMSALPPKADICSAIVHVRFVPEADIAPAAHSNKAAGNAGTQRTRGDIAFAEMTVRCVASAMAMPRPLAMQA